MEMRDTTLKTDIFLAAVSVDPEYYYLLTEREKHVALRYLKKLVKDLEGEAGPGSAPAPLAPVEVRVEPMDASDEDPFAAEMRLKRARHRSGLSSHSGSDEQVKITNLFFHTNYVKY